MTIQILHRYSNAMLFEHDGADLAGANLAGAYLAGASGRSPAMSLMRGSPRRIAETGTNGNTALHWR